MKNLETQYSLIFDKLIKNLTKQYLELLIEEMGDTRTNAQPETFAEKLKRIREKMTAKPALKNVLKAMQSVFARVDAQVVKSIKATYSKRNFPIPRTVLVQTPALKQAIAENVALIKGIVNKQAELLEKAVMKALRQGANFSAVREAVLKQSNKGAAYAQFVAQDQVAKAYAAINAERQASAGIPGYIWSATNDNKTRPTHRIPSGRFFLWNQTMPNDTRPRDKSGKILHPGMDYRCRCSAIPAFDKSDEKLFKKNTFDT